jgi:broad specificity phosphatase PhoE
VPTTTIVLVRHGHVADNDADSQSRLLGWTDPPLSPHGRTQARAVAELLAGEPPCSAIYASPLRRAWDTATTVGVALRVGPRRYDGLREICCGWLDGLPLADIRASFPALWHRNLAQADDRFAWPGGESYRDFRLRVLQGIRALANAHLGERIVLVTHAGVITQLLGALYGESAARWESFRVANASVSELRWPLSGGGELVRFNVGAAAAPAQQIQAGVVPTGYAAW